MNNTLRSYLLITCIFLVASVLRLYNTNWDQNQHLHPDERFLTMVGNAIQLPKSFFSYLDPATSTFNPANNNQKFFVYGTFPLILNKLIALIFHTDSYTLFTLQGRILSGLADTIVVFFIYKIAGLLSRKEQIHSSIKYFAALFYALSVLPIQLAHFFTVDTFLNLFLVITSYFLLHFFYEKSVTSLLLGGIAFGLALACKISALYMLPFFVILIIFPYLLRSDGKWHARSFILSHLHHLLMKGGIFLLLAYFSTRLANPYLFSHASFFDLTINSNFIASIKELKSWEGIDIWFPPAVQWMTKPPVMYSLSNLILYTIGVFNFSAILLGIYVVLKTHRKPIFLFLLSFSIFFFLYQSVQFSKPMRYFLPLFPSLSLLAGLGVDFLSRRIHRALFSIFFLLLFIYPLSYFSIYLHTNTRVAASEWMYKNFSGTELILAEHWDDPLPFLLEENYGKQFTIEQLPIFDPDTPEKWEKMHHLLDAGDYLVLSSNRGWGSIPTVPQKYPLMTVFYKELLANRLSYKKVIEFTSYPSLRFIGIPLTFPDDHADESFTVYDHPKVMIFKHER